jgi:cytochrome c-type biogenesis protein CcmH/NrfG
MGDTLIQQGISLYQKGEYKSAVSAWERYLQMAPPNADTQCIREMIGEAKEAAARKAQKTSATACCPSIWIVV